LRYRNSKSKKADPGVENDKRRIKNTKTKPKKNDPPKS
jgi:hypothetical protein